jgi:transposase InsO family protein
LDELYSKLKEKARGCRDREIRVKLELILLSLKLGNVKEACARRGYSRKYYYKWFARLKKAKWHLDALREYSRRPKRCPKQITRKLEVRIKYFAQRQYGARMIEALLKREQITVSKSTITHVLRKRRKLNRKKVKLVNPHRRRYELVIPGQRLQIDVKYVPEFVDGKRAYAYVAVDECTRWRFVWATHELNQYSTEEFLEKVKTNCPFPIAIIQTDQGQEFSFRRFQNHNVHVEHALTRWCRENGVVHRLLPPGAKELNGKVERSHRIDEQYFYWRAPTDTLENFNAEMRAWIEFYHRERPHGGLNYKTPWEKLCERLVALRTESVCSELEPFKLKFLSETPNRMNNVRQLFVFKAVRKKAA